MIARELYSMSEEIKEYLSKNDEDGLVKVATEFSDLLMNNLFSEEFNSFGKEELKAFELCCTVFENAILHKGQQVDLCFVIITIVSKYEELSSLLERTKILQIPSKIGIIEQEWESSLKYAIEKSAMLPTCNTLVLTETGVKTMKNGCGIRVVKDVKRQLEQINAGSEFPSVLMKIIMELNIPKEEKAGMIYWSTGSTAAQLCQDSFNY